MDLSRPDGRPDALPWQERQRRMRETAILDAAADLLAERGYAATSMDEIAAHVGISKPTLYQHFPSKDAVAIAVMLHRLGHTKADLARAERAVAEGERARPQLERVLRDALARRAGAWSTRVELPRSVIESAPEVGAVRRDVWARIGALVDRAKAEGDCRADAPTPVIARHLAGLFRGDHSDLVDQGAPPEALAATLVSLVFEGLAPREAAAVEPAGGRLDVQRVARR
ncbi:MAG TPA: helix-turn-helix domain-containing protein, partial [Gemmatirosa sp.]